MAKKSQSRKKYTRFDALSVRTVDDNNYWLRCGVAFMNEDGSGGQILLQTIPVASEDGQVKIVLREPLSDDDEKPHRAKAKKRDEQEEETEDEDIPF